ncbi:uncharacterized protein ARMOST_17268 [Armillaria ostoyae]|uniref:Uncharacterized protein n=1 Tax=Armillaria ostoyae TaxID=47428 RepID=A0A284RYN3_ARMOS|nr:uncharacterized protein ARMOST_17268 [Armillaria ostoyae]
MVRSNASYKTIHHRRRMQTLWAIIVNDIIDGQVKVKGEGEGRENSACACSSAALRFGVDKFKVQCSPSDKIVYDKEEVKMLIEEALKGTGRRGRDLAHTELSLLCLFIVLSSITGHPALRCQTRS